MRRNELDYLLSTMLDLNKDVSDLLFTVDKPLQVEAAGQLVPVPVNPPIERLTPLLVPAFLVARAAARTA